MEYHIPVMLRECIEGLQIVEDGVYVDATFGGGGHSKEILKHLGEKGKLFGLDRDDDAFENTIDDKRFKLIKTNYKNIKRFLRLEGITKVDGILADLGVSSHQLDIPERGFSFRYDERLDMRMNQQQPTSAYDVVNHYGVKKLQFVFGEYGEVRNARTLAQQIVEARKEGEIETTGQFLAAIKSCVRGQENKYLAKVFQAIRIEVNEELEALKEFIEQSADTLKTGGRFVVMSYHSLEDRLVKNFFRKGVFEGEPEKDLYGNYSHSLQIINKKPIEASKEELKENPRSRSAKLRIAEKL
ncbi:MAG: 16S rRNA (cytosine(1402)-N(4))-methyltransferase RsmH [Chitinophagales bacterium]